MSGALVTGFSASVGVDLTARAQYQEALRQYNQNQRIIAEKQSLLNDAAYRQYYAAIVVAKRNPDPVARAQAEADAAKQLTSQLSGPAADASNPFPSAPAPVPLPTGTSISNQAAALVGTNAAAQGLFATGTPTVAGETRAALLMAAGDVATAAMLG
ncbi:MAG TPA: hypothetical protein VGH52_03045, partial [Gaiellaceae bacterium]